MICSTEGGGGKYRERRGVFEGNDSNDQALTSPVFPVSINSA